MAGGCHRRFRRRPSRIAFQDDSCFRNGIAPKSIHRAKDRIRQITGRNPGCQLRASDRRTSNRFLPGWITYYRYASCGFELQCMDQWIRRKLRCFRLKQRTRGKSIAAFLRRMGIPPSQASQLGSSGKGPWRLAHTKQLDTAKSVEWFAPPGTRFPGPKVSGVTTLKKPPYTTSTYGGHYHPNPASQT